MNFKEFLYLELKSSPEVLQQIRADLSKEGFVSIGVDDVGNISLNDPRFQNHGKPLRFNRRMDRIFLNDNKTISIDTIGSTIKPAVQKLIKFLLQNNIIDNTWSFNDNRGIGEFIGYKFTHFPDELADKSPEEVTSIEPFSRAISKLILFHGTSQKDWEKIQKFGALTPLFIGSSQVKGFESRAKHWGNKKLLYLATDRKDAWEYAKTRASGVMLDIEKQLERRIKIAEDQGDWEKSAKLTRELQQIGSSRHDSACHRPVKPVLLRVRIPDLSKLRADDDVVNSNMRKIGRWLWNRKSQDEKKEAIARMDKQVGFETASMANHIWSNTEGYEQIISKLPSRIYKAWYASIIRSQQVAYQGSIPIRFIEEIPICPK